MVAKIDSFRNKLIKTLQKKRLIVLTKLASENQFIKICKGVAWKWEKEKHKYVDEKDNKNNVIHSFENISAHQALNTALYVPRKQWQPGPCLWVPHNSVEIYE